MIDETNQDGAEPVEQDRAQPEKKGAGRPKKTIDFKFITENIVKSAVKSMRSELAIGPMLKELLKEEVNAQLRVEVKDFFDKNKFKIKDIISESIVELNKNYADHVENEFSANPKPRVLTKPAVRRPGE